MNSRRQLDLTITVYHFVRFFEVQRNGEQIIENKVFRIELE